jgi:uncharacterized protein YbjT (DUF2867 family)
MKVILFGATGMVGQGVLRECLLDPEVTDVLLIGRASIGGMAGKPAKLRERLVPDLADLSSIEGELGGFDACFFCLGISVAGLTEEAYRRITYDLTIAAATTILKHSPALTFIYVSGAGTDSTERGRSVWARVKGQTENALLRMPFKAAYMFRPAIIRPLHGAVSRTRSYRLFYAVLGWLLPILRVFFPRSITSTEAIGRAMLAAVRHGAPRPIVESWEINDLAAPPAIGAAA